MRDDDAIWMMLIKARDNRPYTSTATPNNVTYQSPAATPGVSGNMAVSWQPVTPSRSELLVRPSPSQFPNLSSAVPEPPRGPPPLIITVLVPPMCTLLTLPQPSRQKILIVIFLILSIPLHPLSVFPSSWLPMLISRPVINSPSAKIAAPRPPHFGEETSMARYYVMRAASSSSFTAPQDLSVLKPM